MQLTLLFAASAALAPGLHAWWTGRALIARTDDPAFPELVLARRQRGIQVLAAAIAVLIVFASSHAIWSVPVLLIGALVGAFPFRRALYNETWNVLDYAGYVIASVVGGGGFWLLLSFGPGLIVLLLRAWGGDNPTSLALILGGTLAVALVAWDRGYASVWLRLHRATPLTRPDLDARFTEIAGRAGIPVPGVFRYGAPGAYSMNAVALPSLRQPRVAFGDTLLEMMTADEITAIFAHELSHIEQHDARLLRQLRIATYALILVAAALPALLLRDLPRFAGIIAYSFPFLVLVALMIRGRRHQARETESDRRSATLLGDPEPMVQALVKLHHHSRLPRRWPHDFERSASHPSLARRIQALRGERASSVPVAFTPTVLRSTTAGQVVVLDATRIYWFDGVPADMADPSLSLLRERAASYRAVACSDLTELRVGVAGLGRALIARDRSGRKWSMPLRAEDVAVAQRALDALDGQLATTAGAPAKQRVNKLRIAVLVTLILSIAILWVTLNSGPDEIPLGWAPVSTTSIGTLAVHGTGYDIAVSPGGQRVAITTLDSTGTRMLDEAVDEELVTWRYVIADSARALRTIEATDLVFADDDRVLTLRREASRDSAVISVESVRDETVAWRRTLPVLGSSTLSVDRAAGRWSLFGYEGEDGEVIVFRGSFDTDSMETTRESFVKLGGLPLLALSDGSMLVTKLEDASDRWRPLVMMGISHIEWELWRVAADGRRLIGTLPGYPECHGSTATTLGFVCSVYERRGRSLWRINDEWTLISLGALPPHLDGWGSWDGNRMVAWTRRAGVLALVDLDAMTLSALPPSTAQRPPTMHVAQTATASNVTAALITGNGQSEVRFYRATPQTRPE
jgi:heat shock protein HtpX